MKKYTAILFLVLLSLTSCKDSFFDLYPTDQMTAENYMNDVEEVSTVLTAAYSALKGDFGDAVVYIGDLPTDNSFDYKVNNWSDGIQLHESSVTSQNGVFSKLWYACYQIINRCCLVEEALDNLGVTGSVYNDLVGQAKFLRAYAYYLMVRVWGDVPLVKEDIKNYMEVFEYGRTPKAEVYSYIVSELSDAASKLPDFRYGGEKGRATATACNAILGDVYLTQGDYAKAKEYFQKVMAKEGADLGLLDDYAKIFDSNNVNNKEIIFSIQYAHNQTPSQFNYLGPSTLGNIQGIFIDPIGDGRSKIYGINSMMMTHELESKFIPGDKRRSVIYTNCISPDYQCSIPMTLKYFDYQNIEDGNEGYMPDSGCHTIISRYSDIILKYAECLANEGNLSEAIKQLARIRTRAGLETDVPEDKTSVLNAIADERQLELCFEGHRWFDLVRTGKLLSTMTTFYSRVNAPNVHPTILQFEYGDNTNIDEHELLYPIPYAQVELNPDKLTQNPGY